METVLLEMMSDITFYRAGTFHEDSDREGSVSHIGVILSNSYCIITYICFTTLHHVKKKKSAMLLVDIIAV